MVIIDGYIVITEGSLIYSVGYGLVCGPGCELGCGLVCGPGCGLGYGLVCGPGGGLGCVLGRGLWSGVCVDLGVDWGGIF